jgi:hypothetical protein
VAQSPITSVVFACYRPAADACLRLFESCSTSNPSIAGSAEAMNNENVGSALKFLIFAIVAGASALGAAAAFADDDIIESARVACQKDIVDYCKDVTRGEGRVLQCLAAHQDKISGRCNYALNDASLQLERVVLAIKHVATECKADLEKHCAEIPVGDGRIAQCLKKNGATLAADCKQALKDTQMEIK